MFQRFSMGLEDAMRAVDAILAAMTPEDGAAAVAVAAFLAERDRLAGKDVVIVLCGANIDTTALKAIL